MSMSPSDRVLRAQLGGYARAAKYDGADMTAAARSRFLARFEHEVDPDGTLDPAERSRRAEAARRAWMTSLALKSAAARRKAREAEALANTVDQELGRLGPDAA